MSKKPRQRESGPALSEDDRVLREVKDNWKEVTDWESNARKLYLEDTKFANGDDENGYQWPNDIRQSRTRSAKPTLTINRTAQHCLNVTNDAKQNKPGIAVRPTGGDATYQAAQAFSDVIRHIEYVSNAEQAYDSAMVTMVQGGMGAWRVVTEYVDDKSFDQDIRIRRIVDPMMIYVDPDCVEADKSDMRFAFVFEDIPNDRFKKEYPEWTDKVGTTVISGDDWITEDHTRIAEYWRRRAIKDELTLDVNGNPVLRSQVGPEIYKGVVEEVEAKGIPARKRPVDTNVVEWFKIAGDTIIDRGKWLGKYIPIVFIVGIETIIENQMDRRGLVRTMRDPQRMYNYWTSAAVEFVALQTKSPWLASARAVEGRETQWQQANLVNYSTLLYNDVDVDGNPIAPPVRTDPPQMSQAYIEGMSISQKEMMMVSGQYEADFGQQGNERSGKAINERQRQGDIATYHFVDSQAVGVRFTGKILLDLIPKVYDTPRIIRMMGEDGTEREVKIDPKATMAIMEERARTGQKAMLVFNPNIGEYGVQADIGPAYATKRQEAWNAFTQIAASSPDLMNVIGDLMFTNADFPGASEIAERLRRLVPPQATGDGPPPEVMALQQQVQQNQVLIAKLLEERARVELENDKLRADKTIDAFNAETNRIKQVDNANNLDPAIMMPIVEQMVRQVLAMPAPQVAPPEYGSSEMPPMMPGGAMQPPEMPQAQGIA